MTFLLLVSLLYHGEKKIQFILGGSDHFNTTVFSTQYDTLTAGSYLQITHLIDLKGQCHYVVLLLASKKKSKILTDLKQKSSSVLTSVN